MTIPRRIQRINIRVKESLRTAIDEASRDMGCSLSQAARLLLVEGSASWRKSDSGPEFATASELLDHLAVLEARAGRMGGAYYLGQEVSMLLRRFRPPPPRA
ncbi:conserved hypothetical protein [Magnetospirillum sp. LM-5]|uniref:hypothetical protein n=1 Tax=Magnetospirillum sp. LM-5 TaxID=2681466 RepID=UPI0013806C32|nr:hypothetical protein [Magnetospirillum sp. LM-5]CAA7614395.1 conserved hypothetical protein [Magnetospirillum sp. LM-5]